MRNNWKSLSNPPRLKPSDFGRRSSGDVLGLLKDGRQRVVTLERYDEPDSAPRWYTACSERWDVTEDMRNWQPLPPAPNAGPVRTRRHVKVLPLDHWMTWAASLEDCLAHGPYKKVAPRFNRPGIYREGASCWFELPDGRAFTFRREDFDFKLAILNAERISRRQAAALAAVVVHRLASPEQETMLRAYRDMMEVRETGRRARKHVLGLRSTPVYDYYHVTGPNGLHLARVNRKSTEAAFLKAIAEVGLYTHTAQDKMGVELLAGADETGRVEVERQLFERAYAGEEACKTWTLWDFTVAGRATLVRRPLENAQ